MGDRSAKFGVMVCKASMVNSWGVDLPADLPILNSFTFHGLLHRRSFRITYERPNNTKKGTQSYTLTCCDKRNAGRILSQPILQRHISVSSTE